MEKILKTTTIFLIVVTTVGGLIFYFRLDLYKTLVQEDGIIENLTAATLLFSAMFLMFRLTKVWRSKNTKWIIFNVLMVIGLLFGFGEEISWGQRIFSIESNDFFTEHNLQKETNLHNLELYGIKINKVLFSYGFTLVFSFYFLFSAILFRKNQFFKKMVTDYGIPIPNMLQTIALVAATIIITTIPDNKKWELWECVFVLIFYWVLLQPYNINEKLLPKRDI